MFLLWKKVNKFYIKIKKLIFYLITKLKTVIHNTKIKMENKIKGYNYEVQVRDYIINKLHKRAYLWKECPETLLINSNIIILYL
jgi:uncharacterized protein YxjI